MYMLRGGIETTQCAMSTIHVPLHHCLWIKPSYDGWWRWSGVVLPCMPSYLEQTAILWTNPFVNTHATDIGEALRTKPPKFGPNDTRWGSGDPMVGRPLNGSNRYRLRTLGFWGCLGHACEVLRQLEIV